MERAQLERELGIEAQEPSFENQPEQQEQPRPVEHEPRTDFELADEMHEQPVAAPVTNDQPVVPQKSEALEVVENILADGMLDVYLTLPPETQSLFKQKGEEVAIKIIEMSERGRLVAKKILKLIRDWLSIIPGVNTFFLEQESKIKTDAIIAHYQK